MELGEGETVHLEPDLRPTERYVQRYEERARRWRAAAWGTLVAGLAILGTSIGLIVWNAGRVEDWESEELYLAEQMQCVAATACQEELTRELVEQRQGENDGLREDIDTVTTIEWSLFALGVVASGIATYLFLGGPQPGRYDHVALVPGRDGIQLALSWTL